MALFLLTWDTLPLPCGLAPGLRLIPGFQSLPELFFRHVCLQLCLPDGPWPTGRQRAGDTLQMCVTIRSKPWPHPPAGFWTHRWLCLQSRPWPCLLLPLTGLPGRTLDLVHPLPCLGLLMVPVISSCLCLTPRPDPGGLCQDQWGHCYHRDHPQHQHHLPQSGKQALDDIKQRSIKVL